MREIRRKFVKIIGSDKTLSIAIYIAAFITFITHYFYDSAANVIVYKEGFVGAALTNILLTCAVVLLLRKIFKG